VKVSYPNKTHSFTLQPAGRDDATGIEIAATPGQLILELKRITEWLETLL
jgi:hypothetical protein